MKYLISILFLVNTSFAAELSVGSMVNMHLTQENLSPLKNKITDNGKFVSSPLFAQLTKKDFSFFATTECMGQLTAGVYYSSTIKKGDTYRLSATVGGYVIQTEKWEKVMRQYWLQANDKLGIVPIVSLKLNKTIYEGNKYKVESITNITPALVQQGVFLTVGF